MNESLTTLESVLCIEELSNRPSRPPDHETESRALSALARALADSPSTILQVLVDTTLAVLEAGSAGISVLTEDGDRLQWPAVAGAWKPHIGRSMQRDLGPCGAVLDRNRPLLFRNFERRYAQFRTMTPPAEECLSIPLEVGGRAVGTIWAISHGARRQFDREDLRLLASLGGFASLAHQLVARMQAFADEAERHRCDERTMQQMNERLLVATLKQHELTEHARAAEMTSARLAAIVRSSGDAIIGADFHGIITSWNRGAERIFGYAAHEVIGRPVSLLIPEDRIDEGPQILERIRRFEVIESFETVRRRKDGTELDVALTVSPVRDSTGRVIGVAKIARDITVRKRLESELNARNAELAAADRFKNQFIALLAHELRNPVFTMSLWTEIIQRPRVTEKEIRQGLAIISSCCEVQSKLIDELLDIHRISTGKVRLDMSDVDLADLVGSEVAMALPAATEQGLDLDHEIEPFPVFVRGDHARLQQVLANLVGNAIKFTPSGGRVHVALRVSDGVAELTVADTGQGITPDALPHVFERFRQADAAMSRDLRGLGLGLSISRTLVELHGGTISAHSAGTGKGATFTAVLPLLVGEPGSKLPGFDEHSGESPSMSPSMSLTGALTGVLVLVVDDDARTRQALQMTLEAAGAETALAAGVAEALDMLQSVRPDVIVSDILMPERDGHDLVRSIRALPPGEAGRVPVIALTACSESEHRDRAMRAGFQSYVVKPAGPAALIAAVATLVAKPRDGGPVDSG